MSAIKGSSLYVTAAEYEHIRSLPDDFRTSTMEEVYGCNPYTQYTVIVSEGLPCTQGTHKVWLPPSKG